MIPLPCPQTEVDVLVLATGFDREDIGRRLERLSEIERSVLEWRAPITGALVSDREIGRRLGIRRREARRIAEIASGKLRHPRLRRASPLHRSIPTGRLTPSVATPSPGSAKAHGATVRIASRV